MSSSKQQVQVKIYSKGLPKVHKAFDDIPPFCPIIDTIGTTHSSVEKHLSEVLYPVIQNQFSIEDSFDAANRINFILPEVKNSNDLVFVSLDVVSLFTNVPLKKTVDIILKRVYNNKEISTTLSKRSLKKLILDTCQKTLFSLNSKMYEQIDVVSMGGCLGPVLTNIIMTEFEKVVAENLIKTGILKFYARFVDGTLLVIKRKDIDFILQKFSSFDKSLKFTINTFEHCVPHFLDIEICLNGFDIYHKNTETGQYTNINSFTVWKWKTSWITSLVIRTKIILIKKFDLSKTLHHGMVSLRTLLHQLVQIQPKYFF